LLEGHLSIQPEISASYYFDNNATTRLLPQVKAKLIEVMDSDFGNPSSAHSFSDQSRYFINESRQHLAKLLNCSTSNLIFTSGATEGNAMVLRTLLEKPKESLLISSKTEHASVHNAAEYLESKGVSVIWLSVDENGLIRNTELEDALRQNSEYTNILVSIVWANSETGIVQDIESLSSTARKYGAYFHTDASQAVGRISIDLSEFAIDFLTFTGHKLHAPSGIGAVYAKNWSILSPLLIGGEQEFGMRSGTENVLHIAALGEAVRIRNEGFDSIRVQLGEFRDLFESVLKKQLSGIEVNGEKSDRVPNTSNIFFPGIDGRALLAQLDLRSVYCSQTSACSSMLPEPSRTLREMGLSFDDAFSSLRFSFAIDNTEEEIKRGAELVIEAVEHLRKTSIWREQ
jgi:cysteine desulfurase